MVTTAPELPCVPTILKEYSARKLQIPSLQELLGSHGTPNYPYGKKFEKAKNDPIFVLHTSGSTGN
jgi:acyl-coenzyme A synthetase/AMP-(fatty) acid ligase